MAHVIDREEWAVRSDHWKGELQCGAYGSNSCLIFNYLPDTGGGPRLHTHPYAEVFVVQSGRLTFVVGETSVEVGAGQIVIAPPGVPHKFTNTGTTVAAHIDIHTSERMETTWLER